MFGYGSLLLQRSMELTLGYPYSRKPVPCLLEGWRRCWDVIMPNQNFYEVREDGEFIPQNIIYLNVRPAVGDAANGLLYVLEPEELAAFDRREWVYERRAVGSAIKGVAVEGGEVYAYVAKPEWSLAPGQAREWAALRASYLAIIEEGLVQLGAGFRSHYESSTDATPMDLIFNDRKREGTHPLLADPQPQ